MNQVSIDSLLLIGKVIRPHGLRGLVRIWSYARSEASFLDAERVFLRSVSGEIREFLVTSVKPLKNILLMRLEGIDSAGDVEKYRDAEVFISKETLSREDDEFFWYEILGLRVYLETGEYLGAVSRIMSQGGNDIYVVKDGNKEILIPATYEVVKEIDLENGKMIVTPMEGLLDLNEV